MSARRIVSVGSLAIAASMPVHGLGIVGAPSNATLGAPLNFPIRVRIDSNESLNSTCVTAEASQGDQRIAPSSLRTSIEQGSIPDERVVRVYTTVAIDEPVVTVTLTLGCAGRFERRFTVFADPPLVTVAAAPEAVAPSSVEPTVATTPTRREAAASAPRADGAPPGGSMAEPAAAASQPVRSSRPTVGHAPARSAAAMRPTARRPAARAVAAAPATSEAPTAAAAARGGAAPARALAASGPRLKLDPLEPIARGSAAASAAAAVQEAQLRVAAMAASAAIAEQAASAAIANAAAAAERLRALEQGLEKLRADAERDREQAAAIRSKLARAETAGRLTPWLVGGMVLLAVLALWLWLRMRRLQREREAAWWAASRAAAKPPPNPPTLHPMTLPPQVAPPPLVKPEATVIVKPATMRKPAFRDSLFASQQEPRDVSIEELIDLEQQAEFFVVLGQEDAAIDLLVDHLRKTGGGSPMPYLKLLEIYRRRGDHEAYERTRARFNHRFNAYAPQWDADASEGRALEDYPAIVARLQQVWPVPLDAMAELEALLFRKARGELFDLPAYRDVIFLYSLARDLLDRESLESGKVDVLLPISESGEHTQPMSLEDLPPAEDSDLMSLDQPTVPIDLDVTQPMSPHSLFGETDPATLGKGRRRRNGG